VSAPIADIEKVLDRWNRERIFIPRSDWTCVQCGGKPFLVSWGGEFWCVVCDGCHNEYELLPNGWVRLTREPAREPHP
jgi:hypothetical protein